MQFAEAVREFLWFFGYQMHPNPPSFSYLRGANRPLRRNPRGLKERKTPLLKDYLQRFFDVEILFVEGPKP